jgi:hypothetical protein
VPGSSVVQAIIAMQRSRQGKMMLHDALCTVQRKKIIFMLLLSELAGRCVAAVGLWPSDTATKAAAAAAAAAAALYE